MQGSDDLVACLVQLYGCAIQYMGGAVNAVTITS